ncbi:hypothetical protein GJU41_20255 [Bacillus idriensis]|uniref:Uncharacterized protein n=1 Tax=Metabacillus idriensis TaxID=324768 RepID=A0A6I2MDC7_9BACI|nr:DUF6886 family protein [Metabacillus idriensis]MRX56298.1 hypothetical protein [Metabacillus idriensis]
MLYHFSEDPSIDIFKPRQSASFPSLHPVVWAIDQEHALHYYFPRDCPRVIYWKGEKTTEEDSARFFAESIADKIIVIETSWLERIRRTNLYLYSFNPGSFELFEGAKTAGYYVSSEEAVPIKVEPAGDLLEKLLKENAELRFTPNLYPIRNHILLSSLDFSIIRFRNAARMKEG